MLVPAIVIITPRSRHVHHRCLERSHPRILKWWHTAFRARTCRRCHRHLPHDTTADSRQDEGGVNVRGLSTRPVSGTVAILLMAVT